MAAVAQPDEDKIIDEEHKIWKKNTPFLYDLVLTHALEWPALTCQWLPDSSPASEKGFTKFRLLLGTHTSDGEQNHLMLHDVILPTDKVKTDSREYNDAEGGFGHAGAKTMPVQKINHKGEVNRLRYMPQNPVVIATKSPDGNVYLFDYTRHESVPPATGEFTPNATLKGHQAEGYGLCWNPNKEGFLASGSDDQLVCLWDVSGAGKEHTEIEPLAQHSLHKDVVEEVHFHAKHEHILASVGDDRRLLIVDTRDMKAKHDIEAHKGEANSVAFHPSMEHILATGGADKVVKLWDLRNMKRELFVFESHSDEVLQVAWSPTHETILASSSKDRRINVWDLARVGLEQSPEDTVDGPPELLFVHGGHCGRVSDMSWSATEPWLMASVSEDNILQVWEMSEHIYLDEDDLTNVPEKFVGEK